MALDWPAFGEALWRVNDELGIRPEWQLPVLYLESSFDPSIKNPGGCVGLNQLCPSTYPRYVSVPVSEYRTWTASQQLSGPVLTYWRDALKYGQIRSATRVMLSQLGHGLLKADPNLDSVVFASPSAAYTANASVFDPSRKGYFTVQDIANAVAQRAKTPAVQDAIAQAYAMRPNERPSDPVYGYDFGATSPASETVAPPTESRGTAVIVVGVLAVAVGVGYIASQRGRHREELPPRRFPIRRWVPPPRYG